MVGVTLLKQKTKVLKYTLSRLLWQYKAYHVIHSYIPVDKWLRMMSVSPSLTPLDQTMFGIQTFLNFRKIIQYTYYIK